VECAFTYYFVYYIPVSHALSSVCLPAPPPPPPPVALLAVERRDKHGTQSGSSDNGALLSMGRQWVKVHVPAGALGGSFAAAAETRTVEREVKGELRP
jgi:hypothetical protein